MSTIFKDEYYGALLQNYVNAIINSRMLLDEDLEVLISTYEFSTTNEFKSSDFPYGLTAALGSLIASSFVVKLLNGSPVYLIPPSLVTVSVAVQEIIYRSKKDRHYKLIDELIIVLNDLDKLLDRIYRYFQSRSKVKERYVSDFFNAYNKFVINFIDSFSNSQLELNEFYFNNMTEISKFCDMLAEDCHNYSIPTDFLQQPEDTDVEKCFSTIEKFEKVQVLVNSKLLGYLGVIFCDKSSCLDKKYLNLLLNVRIPEIITSTRRQHDYLKGLFIKFKKSVAQLSRHKMQSVTVSRNFISKKLNAALENTLYNLSFVTEKTHNILEAIEKQHNDDTATIERISKGLVDLRRHTFSTFESLDLLCNMYGILAIRKSPTEKTATEPTTTSSQIEDKDIKTINYDDEQKTSDEYYELYLEKQFDDLEQEQYYEEKSDNNLSLLLQELRQALNTHERFLEARKKREHLEIDKKPPIPPPRKSKTNIPDDEKIKTIEMSSQSSTTVEIPCPPPLPMAAPHLTEPVSVSNHSELLEGIKLLASQLNCQEETFGSDGSISEDD